MKHDSHATGSSRQAGRRPTRPDLGRPSLFADFDQDSVEDIEPQRIRLLSALESQRGVRGRPRGHRRPTGRAHPWLTRSLMALMALGMLVMLLSFIQLLRRPPPTLPVQQALAAAPAVPSALVAPERPAVAPEAAEIIDTEPPAGGHPAAAVSALPATAAQALAPAPKPVPEPATAPTARAADTDRAARPVKAPVARPAPTARRDNPASQDDVALVEAMLAHASPRKAAPAPSEALRQCGTGTSPETSVCRARVCVQHPSLPACHAR